ncbi:MAG: hypothetical protein ACN6ON_12065, partial [Sphingobacterium sp.]
MGVTEIFVVIVWIGIVSLVAGIILLLLYFALTLICAKGSWENLIEKLFTTAYYVMQIGMVIFLLALAGMAIGITIDGIAKGEYKLRFSRIGGNTTIKWTARPIRFAFQTVAFIGFSIVLVYL